MKRSGFRPMIILAALVATATHFVRADGKFLFSEHNDAEYVNVAKIGSNPFKFKFSRCRAEGDCVDFGKKQGYTMEDVRIRVFKLEDKRENGRLSSAESRDLEMLREVIEGLESPRLSYPRRGYTHLFKGSVDHFVHVVSERL